MKSMTGYGAAEGAVGTGRLFIEVRAVNHRYSEIYLKIPPKLNVIDPKLRKEIQAVIQRGKTEVFIKECSPVAPVPKASVNVALARVYARCLRDLEKALGAKPKDLLDMVDLRELIRLEEEPVRYERYWQQIRLICAKALAQLERMRVTEGRHIEQDQRRRLKHLEQLNQRVAKRSAANAQATLAASAASGNGGAGENGRSGSSATSRSDITEELVRFASHCTQFRQFLASREPVGRQLDFLLQELHREVNTMASKAGDAQIAQMVVTMKSELEKLREQAQNIE